MMGRKEPRNLESSAPLTLTRFIVLLDGTGGSGG